MRLTPLEPWTARKIGHPNERLARADLERYQIEKLGETMRLARAKSLFYRSHLADAPQVLVALDDLTRFPFTSAQDIRDHPLHFLCTSQDDIQRVVTLDTSGTTGAPKRIYFTKDDQELTVDFFHVGMSTFTDPGDRVLILLPCERPGSVGDLLAIALGRLSGRGIRHGPGHSEAETMQAIARENANGIVGTPTQVLALARQRGATALRLKSVLLTTDHVPNAIRSVVGRSWGCTVYNHYGMTEMGLGGGVDCQARRGYHLREADLFFEIVNPQTGLPVSEGDTGEVVFTTLTRRGMPLIRYRTGDLSRFIPGQCPCGTSLKTLEHIRNRIGGFVRVGEGEVLTLADLDEALFPIEGLVDFAATLARTEVRTRLSIQAKMAPGYPDNTAALIDSALGAIPSIRRAQESRALDVESVVLEQEVSSVPRLAKRMIIDHRG